MLKKQSKSVQGNSYNKPIANIEIKIDPEVIGRIESESTMFVFLKSKEKSPPLYAIKTKVPENFPI